jgi:PadR family transcriptional regulator PadR
MSPRPTNPNFMNGVPELLILGLLQNDEMYGYEIVQAISNRTGTAITLGEGVVYPVLHTLEQSGALTARRRTVNGRNRIYYAATASGTRRFADLSQSWLDHMKAVKQMLTGANHGQTIS